jgi:peroxiredoxin
VGEIPHEKALVERFGEEGFAILGINTDADKEDYLKKKAEYGVTWRSVFNGSPEGGIPTQWGVMGYPTTYLIDHKGVIRAKDLRGTSVDPAVEGLLKELHAENGAE